MLTPHVTAASHQQPMQIKKKIQAPWVPDVADPLDTSNFESLDDAEDEDFLKGKAPLTAKEQLVFSDF